MSRKIHWTEKEAWAFHDLKRQEAQEQIKRNIAAAKSKRPWWRRLAWLLGR